MYRTINFIDTVVIINSSTEKPSITTDVFIVCTRILFATCFGRNRSLSGNADIVVYQCFLVSADITYILSDDSLFRPKHVVEKL